jgi:hypothetical protein
MVDAVGMGFPVTDILSGLTPDAGVGIQKVHNRKITVQIVHDRACALDRRPVQLCVVPFVKVAALKTKAPVEAAISAKPADLNFKVLRVPREARN